MSLLDQTLSAAAIQAAATRIEPYIRRTPVLRAAGKDFGLPGISIAFKLEMTQHAGSFKSRGAFYHMLTRTVPAAGVVAASGGNHGAAVAFAARRLGIRARIFVPTVASPAKIEQIREYGAELEVGGERYADALAASEAYVAASGAMSIHAFDQVETLLGQGTLGAEFEADVPDLSALLVAVGGGGLIGGIATWTRGRIPLIGVEPEAAPTLAYALRAGAPVDAPAGGVAADSLAPRRIGELVLPIAQRYVSASILVTDDAIRQAQAELWRVLRVVVEPGGAAAFAALRGGAWRATPGQTVGVVLCGANTTAVKFA